MERNGKQDILIIPFIHSLREEFSVLRVEQLFDYLDLVNEPCLVILGFSSFFIGISELPKVFVEHIDLSLTEAFWVLQYVKEYQAFFNFLDSTVATSSVQLAALLVVLTVVVLRFKRPIQSLHSNLLLFKQNSYHSVEQLGEIDFDIGLRVSRVPFSFRQPWYSVVQEAQDYLLLLVCCHQRIQS